MSETAYPLCWPQDQPRTPPHKQGKSKFVGGDVMKAQRELREEVRRLGGRGLIISSNVAVRNDGQLYADAARRRITDPGVAVYFTLNGQSMCFACDRWWSPWENIQAIAKTIEALRGIERWGSTDMIDRAFRGYTALPAPGSARRRPWTEVLEISPSATPEEIRAAYKDAARRNHPDNGGTDDRMAEVNAAYAQALQERGLA